MPTAVVTGAGRGLGAAIAVRFASAGWHVVRADVEGTDTYLDVTDAQGCRELAEAVQPDVWINNAGVLGAGDAATQPDQVIEQVVSVNLLGVIHSTRAALAVMREREQGRGGVESSGSAIARQHWLGKAPRSPSAQARAI